MEQQKDALRSRHRKRSLLTDRKICRGLNRLKFSAFCEFVELGVGGGFFIFTSSCSSYPEERDETISGFSRNFEKFKLTISRSVTIPFL